MSEKVLIIIAHSDDETIGMGGAIRHHIKKGDKVYVSSMTDGVSSRSNIKNKDKILRKKAAKKASLLLGFEWIKCFNFDDNEMDKYTTLEIVKKIENIKNKLNPTIIYTHSMADLNIDHRVISNAVLTAFRPEPSEYCNEIRLFEIPSASDYGNPSITRTFSPNLFIDISDEWEFKYNALCAYDSEIKSFPHSRSYEGIKNLAKIRGNQVGLELAEAFEVIRKIIR